MHKYLRAIGFSKYNRKKDMKLLLDLVEQSATDTSLVVDEDVVFGYLSRAFGDRFGLRVYGEYEKGQDFETEQKYYIQLSF